MAETSESSRKHLRKKRHGGRYCAAGGPGSYSCTNTSYTEGVSMHVFPKDEETRNKWTKFVRIHRPNFVPLPGKGSALCSQHFESSCYTFSLDVGSPFKRFMERGSLPTIFAKPPDETCSSSQSSRDKRDVSWGLACTCSAGLYDLYFPYIHILDLVFFFITEWQSVP